MALQQLLVASSLQSKQSGVILLRRVAANVVVVHIVGGSDDIQRSRRSTGDAGTATAAVGRYLYTALGSECALNTFMLGILDGSRQETIVRSNLVFQGTAEVNVKRQGTFLRGCQSYDNGMVGKRSKDGTFILYTLINIRGGIQSRTDIQFTTVARHIRVS